ncbi:hypothetical protein pb186bvf_002861 [Paramecium bursaria]
MGCALQKIKQKDKTENNLNFQYFPSIWEPNRDIQVFSPKPIAEHSLQSKDQPNQSTEYGDSRFSNNDPRIKKYRQKQYTEVKVNQSLEGNQKSLKNKMQSEQQIRWYYEPSYSKTHQSQIQNSRIILISLEAIQKD